MQTLGLGSGLGCFSSLTRGKNDEEQDIGPSEQVSERPQKVRRSESCDAALLGIAISAPFRNSAGRHSNPGWRHAQNSGGQSLHLTTLGRHDLVGKSLSELG